MASVYLVTCLKNGKRYVGFTSRQVDVRWREHTHGKAACPALYKALRKHGESAFVVHVLATGMSVDFALALESAAIASLGTRAPLGYNLTSGGEYSSYERTPENRARMSLAKTGQTHTEETKALLRSLGTGKKPSAETRARLSASGTGRTHSEATKRKMSAARTSHWDEKWGDTRAEALRLLGEGLTQVAVAKKLGVHPNSVYSWFKATKE